MGQSFDILSGTGCVMARVHLHLFSLEAPQRLIFSKLRPCTANNFTNATKLVNFRPSFPGDLCGSSFSHRWHVLLRLPRCLLWSISSVFQGPGAVHSYNMHGDLPQRKLLVIESRRMTTNHASLGALDVGLIVLLPVAFLD
jgi:hypothetical protein